MEILRVLSENFREWLEHWKPLAGWLVALGTIFLGIVVLIAPKLESWSRGPDLFITKIKKLVPDMDPQFGPIRGSFPEICRLQNLRQGYPDDRYLVL